MVGDVAVACALQRATLGPGRDHRAADAALVLAHVGEQRPSGDVADGVEPVAVDARDGQVVVGRDEAVGLADRVLDAYHAQPDVPAARCAPGGNHHLVHGDRPAAEGDPHLAPVDVPDAGVSRAGALDLLDRDADVHADAAVFEVLLDQLTGERLELGEQCRPDLDDREFLDAQPAQPGRGLAGNHAATDDRDPARYLVQVGDVARRPRQRLAQAGHRRDGGGRAGRQHHRVPGVQRAGGAVGCGDFDRAHAGQSTAAPDDVDAESVGPAHLRAVVEVVDEGVAPREHSGDVERLLADDALHARDRAGGREYLDRAQQSLARHARPVRTFAADEFLLDQERPPVAALDRVLRHVLAGRPAADDDYVGRVGRAVRVGRFAHAVTVANSHRVGSRPADRSRPDPHVTAFLS